uniref:Carbohydrate kinase FGGY N-terminal domain-containing protein n=1 Tax=Acrobeloides nanus TaxID=290746 RepID=A0A914DLL0_9BILA
MESITAGIDLGTTSVKISIVKCDLTVIQELSSPHNATLTNPNPKQHEQNPMKICNTVMELLEKCNLSQIDQIVVTGQMHGVVLWEHKSVMDFVYGVSQGVNCSNLITWMDQSTLPKWLKKTGEEESKISTGYGLATLAWLQAHNQLNESWDRAGTIMDFFISLISKNKDSFISDQNAYSWGYVENGQWTIADKHETWPVKLLPKIVTPFQNTFHASIELFGVSKETKIFVGLGDLQASILPFIQPGEAVINFGTSAQMVFPLSKDVLHGDLAKEFPHLLRVPFFDEKLLVVAASLNGGNALECFLKQIQLWAVQISNQQLNKVFNFWRSSRIVNR